MKKTLLFVLIAISTLANANPIGKQEAMKLAMRFLKQKQSTTSTRAKSQRNQLKMVMQCPNAYYVFNNGNGQGFVITSADDRTDAVLGYAYTGKFDVNNIPVQLKDLLSLYEHEIKTAVRLRLKNLKTTSGTRAGLSVKRSIHPLIETRWNQGAPYNDACPMGAFERTVTGCVATAMAQVMYYHQCPRGETLDTIPGYKSPKIGKVLDTLPKTTFDWKNMLRTYDENANREQKNAVAKLMKYCGVSTEMDYATAKQGGSGTVAVELPYALTHYFGYSKAARYADRSGYTSKTWNNMIYEELKEGRPVLYGGVTPTGGGHEFVCDGYESGDYFHINWGWSGLSDGYFRLSVLNPDQQGIGSFEGGYSLSQCAILGVKPNEGEEQLDAMTVIDLHLRGLSQMSRKRIEQGFKGLSMSYELFNYMLLPFEGQMGVGLYKDGKLMKVVHESDVISYEPITPKRTFYKAILKNFGAGLKGDYQLLPMCKEKKSNTWQLCPGAEKSVCNLHITETQLNASIINPQTIDLKLVSIDMPKVIKTGRTYTAMAKIKNVGPDFTGSLSFVFGNKRSVLGLSIAPGATIDVPLSFQPDVAKPKTQYHINVWDSMQDRDIDFVGKGEVDVAEGKNVPDAKLTASVFCTNGSSKKADELYGTHMEGRFEVKNTATDDYDRDLLIAIVGEKQDVQMKQLNAIIPAGKTITLPFAFDNLIPGTRYIVTLLGYEGIYLKGKAICNGAITCKAAVMKYLADGTPVALEPEESIDLTDAIAVDMRDLNVKKGTKLRPSNNPNCLYYLHEASIVPETLKDKNVILGDEAPKITLQTNQPIKMLRNFTAREITCQRPLVANGKDTESAWTTLSLPFVPNDMKINGQPAELHVYNFVHEQENKLYFNTTQHIEAYCPYLLEIKHIHDTTADMMLTIHGKDVEVNQHAKSVLGSDNYNFVGTIGQHQPGSAYLYNAATNRFELSQAPTVECFSAFVEPNHINNENAVRSLAVVLDDVELGIPTHTTTNAHQYVIYNLQGVKVGEGKDDIARLPKGVYVVNGKKVIK